MAWYNTYRQDGPNQNSRLNPLVLDFRTEETLSGAPLENAVKAVKLICDGHPGPYTLFISGGVDSQAMLYAWNLSGEKFRAIHYSYGVNTEDTISAVKACINLGVPLDVRMFDAKAFIQSEELIELAKIYDCSSPQILTYIKLLKRHPETCILAGNFIDGSNAGLNWTILALQRLAESDKPNLVPFFFLSTPQLAYSFYDSLKTFLLKSPLEEYMAKVETFKATGFQVEPQSQKLTGFEEIKASFDHIEVAPSIRQKWIRQQSKRPFDLLYRYSLYDHIGLYRDGAIVHVNPQRV